MSVDKDENSTSSSSKVRPRTPAQVKAESAARKAKVIFLSEASVTSSEKRL